MIFKKEQLVATDGLWIKGKLGDRLIWCLGDERLACLALLGFFVREGNNVLIFL